MNNKINMEEYERLKAMEEKQKERIKKQNAKQNENNDRISFILPKGYKDKIKKLTGKSCNAYVSELVLKDIERLEKEQNSNDLELPFS